MSPVQAFYNWPNIQTFQIAPGDIHLWWIKLPDDVIHARHEKNHQYKQERRLILEMILEKYCPEGFEILENQAGKPYLKEHSIHFNTSHSGPYLAIALACLPIGVDIEQFKLRDFNYFSQRFFGLSWYDKHLSIVHPSLHGLYFFKQWTQTEAWVKVLGCTIFNHPEISNTEHAFLSFTPRLGIDGALCYKGTIHQTFQIQLDWSSPAIYHQHITLCYENHLKRQLKIPKLKLYFLDETASTQDYLKNYKQIPGIHICHAEVQTQGKGRLGRTWKSIKGQNILCSILYPMEQAANQLDGLSLVIGLAIANVFKQTLNLEVQIKWPNDIYYQGKKLAGILIELVGSQKNTCQIMIGFGVNVNESPDTLLASATSLFEITQKKYNRRNLLKDMIIEIHQQLNIFEQHGFTAFLSSWKHYDLLANQPVKLTQMKQKISGIAKGINDKGHLIVEDENNCLQEVGFGEVSIQSFSHQEKD